MFQVIELVMATFWNRNATLESRHDFSHAMEV